MLGVANMSSARGLLCALMDNVRAHEIEGQCADKDQYDVRISVHDPDETLKIGK